MREVYRKTGRDLLNVEGLYSIQSSRFAVPTKNVARSINPSGTAVPLFGDIRARINLFI